jgi:DNA-binding SARP family transcriptional activator
VPAPIAANKATTASAAMRRVEMVSERVIIAPVRDRPLRSSTDEHRPLRLTSTQEAGKERVNLLPSPMAAPRDERDAIEFRVLGPLEVRRDDRQIPLGGPKQRALLALLLLQANEALSAERLIDRLWGERPPATAAKALQVYVSQLRKLLEPERTSGSPGRLLVSTASGYTLRLEDEQLDLRRFLRLRKQGQQALTERRAAEAARLLGDALALWRGAALADVADEPFAQLEAARLEGLRLAALEERIEADLQLGRHAELVGELEALVAEHPLRESFRGRLMLALYRSGRQAEALEAYQRMRRTLVEELGIEPGRRLRELEQAILRQDPALELVSGAIEGPHALSKSPFVGRRRELETLRAGLDDAVHGRGGLYLLVGEPGIGKSRLAGELISHAQAREAEVLVGRCWEAGGAPAYWPWIQALRTYVRRREPERLRAELGAGAPDLAQLLPELRELFPDLPERETTESEGDRFRLFDAATSFLKAASRTRPLVLILDDLHAADEPSLLLLRFVARELESSRLFVLGAYRDVDPTLSEPLAGTLVNVTREAVTRRIVLEGLDAPAIAEYIELTAGQTPLHDLVDAIRAETEGNPLFLSEVVQLLAQEGRFDLEEVRRLGVPEGVREVISLRLRRLSTGCNSVLAIASVLGREFDLEALESVKTIDHDSLLELVDEAVRARVISEIPGAPGRLRFAHVLIRDVVYDALPGARRAKLHQRVGDAVEELYAPDLEPHLSELAHHYFHSRDAHKAVSYARRAGDRALALVAYEEAIRLYGMALQLNRDEVARCDILLALGDAQARAGDTPAAKATFREAAHRADALDLPDQLARAALGYGGRFTWEASRDDDYFRPLLEHALDVLGDRDASLRARLLARLSAGPLRDARFPPERRALLRREAVELARRIGDPATIAYALNGYVLSEGSPDLTRERLELGHELVAAALAIGDKQVALEGHSTLLVDLLELGDLQGALAELEAMANIAEELRQPSQHWFVRIFRAELALLQGRFTEAEALMAEALDLGERAQRWIATVSYRLQLYMLRREQGRLAEVEEVVHESVEAYPTYFVWRPIQAQMLVELGRDEEARQAFDALAAEGFDDFPHNEHWLVGMGLLAETAWSLRDANRAARIYELLRPYADRIAISYGEISTGSVSRPLGLLAATIEGLEDPARHFEQALVMNERMCARPWLAHTQTDYAQILLEHQEPSGSDRAWTLLDQAVATYRQLGMNFYARRALRLREQVVPP